MADGWRWRLCSSRVRKEGAVRKDGTVGRIEEPLWAATATRQGSGFPAATASPSLLFRCFGRRIQAIDEEKPGLIYCTSTKVMQMIQSVLEADVGGESAAAIVNEDSRMVMSMRCKNADMVDVDGS